jgi:hypothetical protein
VREEEEEEEEERYARWSTLDNTFWLIGSQAGKSKLSLLTLLQSKQQFHAGSPLIFFL